MYLSSQEAQTPAPTISSVQIFTWFMSLVSVGLVGLIVFESIRLTHKPTESFHKFITAANLSAYNKCLKNNGGDGCRKHLIKEWEKINGD